VFRATGVESSCGRGRIQLVKAAAEGRASFTKDYEPILFECLLCRACVEACAPRAETDLIVAIARNEWFKKRGRNPATDVLFRELLGDRSKLEMAASLAFKGIDWGLAKAAQVTGLLRLQPRASVALDWLGSPPKELLTKRLRRMRLSASGTKRRVGYFVSCGVNMLSPDAGEATVRLLSALGCEVVPLPNACCGLPAYVYGDWEAAEQHILDAARVYREAGPLDAIVTDCGSCSSHLRHVAELIGLEDAQLDLVHTKTKDLAEFVSEIAPRPTARVDAQVTYHDPCHLSRHQDLTTPPRELLSAVEGVDFREMKEADWCCGGAGSYGIEHAEISKVILGRKMGWLEETGANVLTTACPACITQLGYGTRRHELPVRVGHISEILARAYGADLPPLEREEAEARATEAVEA
jgi:glycolate oxidase iron-sulfur subunit